MFNYIEWLIIASSFLALYAILVLVWDSFISWQPLDGLFFRSGGWALVAATVCVVALFISILLFPTECVGLCHIMSY